MLEQSLLVVLILGVCAVLAALFSSCAGTGGGADDFSESLQFLKDHTPIVVLTDPDGGGRAAVAPNLSARVMTAAFHGEDSPRLGWINEPVVAGKERNPAFINYGGAERLWLAPEGGQFALFFEPGDPFDLAHWRTPAAFNSEPYEIIEQNGRRISMAHDMKLRNYQGALFQLRVTRSISMVARGDLVDILGFEPSGSVQFVGYKSENALINRGFSSLSMGKGLASIWILSQFDANAGTWVIFPFRAGEGEGPAVNDDYFGKVPEERLKVSRELGCALFLADGRRRSKIGLSLEHARDTIGSMDFGRNILTVVAFALPRQGYYAANTWETQAEPFRGDVVNSYNNGPEGEDGWVPERFYELETLSPVEELAPGHRLEHTNVTLHFCGPLEELNEISRRLLKVDLEKARAVAAGMTIAMSEADEMNETDGAAAQAEPGAENDVPGERGAAEGESEAARSVQAPVKVGGWSERKTTKGRRPGQ